MLENIPIISNDKYVAILETVSVQANQMLCCAENHAIAGR